jgi:hypothetical protein
MVSMNAHMRAPLFLAVFGAFAMFPGAAIAAAPIADEGSAKAIVAGSRDSAQTRAAAWGRRQSLTRFVPQVWRMGYRRGWRERCSDRGERRDRSRTYS